jgi:hypothetical protein
MNYFITHELSRYSFISNHVAKLQKYVALMRCDNFNRKNFQLVMSRQNFFGTQIVLRGFHKKREH